MVRSGAAVLAMCALIACDRQEPEPEEPSPPASEAKASEQPKPAPESGLLDGPAAPSTWSADVQARVTVPDRALLRVAAAVSPTGSTLWAQAITEAGEPAGPAKSLREVPGAIEEIAAAYDGTTLWVASISAPDPSPRRVEELAGYDLKAKPTVEAKQLRPFQHSATEGPTPTRLRMVPRAGEAAGVALATLAGTELCRGMLFVEQGMVPCHQLRVDLVAADGTVEHTYANRQEGDEPRIEEFFATEAGAVVSFSTKPGKVLTDVTLVTATEDRAMGTCGTPPYDLAWVGEGLLSMCRKSKNAGDISLSCSPKRRGCGKVRFVRADGKLKGPIPVGKKLEFDRLTVGCKDDTPTVRIGIGKDHVDVPSRDLDILLPPEIAQPCTGTTLE